MKRQKIGEYTRLIPVSKARLFENVFDWEHLPHLHHSTFASLELVAKTSQSFQARVCLRPRFLKLHQKISLIGSRKRSMWLVRVCSGFQKGLVILSRATVLEERKLRVQVEFFAPSNGMRLPKITGKILALTYRKLYDEDAAMMVERQKFLDRQRTAPNSKNAELEGFDLGPIGELEQDLPCEREVRSEKFLFFKVEDRILAYKARCPHWQAPLQCSDIKDSHIQCPWHGYRFALADGACHEHRLQLTQFEVHAIKGRAVLNGLFPNNKSASK